jgi:hypothetical protein
VAQGEKKLLQVQIPRVPTSTTCFYPESDKTGTPFTPISFLKKYLYIVLPFTPSSFRWSFSHRFPHQNPVWTFFCSYITCLAHLILVVVTTRMIWRRLWILTLTINEVFSSHLLHPAVWFNCIHQHRAVEHPLVAEHFKYIFCWLCSHQLRAVHNRTL